MINFALRKLRENAGTDPDYYLVTSSNPYIVKITAVGTTTYIAKAAPGSSQATPVWQAKRISVSGSDTLIEWADGNAKYDNSATDLTALSYS
jgi:hypothetical protein